MVKSYLYFSVKVFIFSSIMLFLGIAFTALGVFLFKSIWRKNHDDLDNLSAISGSLDENRLLQIKMQVNAARQKLDSSIGD